MGSHLYEAAARLKFTGMLKALLQRGWRLHVAVFTIRDDGIRLISLRKANKREVKNYA